MNRKWPYPSQKPYFFRSIFGSFQQLRGVPRFLYLIRKFVFPRYEAFELLRTKNRTPLTIDRDDYGHIMQFYFLYSPELITLLPDILLEGDFCLDLGANIGLLAFTMSRIVGDTGLVIVVEPNPQLVKLIDSTIQKAHITNVRTIKGGVAGNDGQGSFSSPTGASASGEIDLYSEQGITVDVYTIGSIRKKIIEHERAIDFIKVDIEGAEAEIIESLHELFEAGERPILLIEFHPKKIRARSVNHETIRNALYSYNYKERYVYEDAGYYRLEDNPNPLTTNVNLLFVQPSHLEQLHNLRNQWQNKNATGTQ